MSLMAKLIIGVALASQHQRNLLLREEESVTDLLADISTHERHCSDRGGCEVGSSSSPQHIPENDEQLNSGDDSGRGEVSDLLGNLPTTDLIDRTRVDIVGEGRAEEATYFPTNLSVVTNRDDSGGGGRVEGEERLDIERGEYHPLPNPRQVSRTRKRIDKDLSYRPPTKRQKLPVPMSRLGLELPSISRSTLNPATTLARPEDQNQPERHCSDRGGFEVGISSSPPYIPESDEQLNSEEVLLFSDENNAPCTGSDGPESGDDSGRGEVSDLLGNLPTTDLIDRTRVDIVGEGREEEATGVPGNLPHSVENFPETVTDRTRDGREEEATNFPVLENLIQPVPAQPVPAQPVPTHLVPAQPVPAQPVPAQPVPAHPVPAQPVPAHPVPAQPVPAQPVPAQPVPAHPVPAHPLQPNPRRVPRWKIIDNKWPKYVYSKNPDNPKYPMKWWIPKTRQPLPKSQCRPKSYNDFEFMFREFFPSGLNLAAKFPLDQPEDQNQPDQNQPERHCSDRGGFEVGSSSRSPGDRMRDDSLGDGREEEAAYLRGNLRHPAENYGGGRGVEGGETIDIESSSPHNEVSPGNIMRDDSLGDGREENYGGGRGVEDEEWREERHPAENYGGGRGVEGGETIDIESSSPHNEVSPGNIMRDDSLGDGREEGDTYLLGNVRHPAENIPTVVTNRDDSGGGSPSPNNDEEAEESQWASFKKLSMELSLDRKESFWLFTQYLVLSQLEDGAKKEGYTTLLQMRQDPPEEGEDYGDIRIKARPRGPNDRIQHPDELGL
ncbi:uncharacterized protein LOC9303741 isoform X1 [Arabidopsis lyrata subsp. lyrata]|uniref:uncharacterized protein LOC9303741 isoform X1 n=1 Tax=Arabidopsis lyrata subsp. lyrata TaxID=81972 RepID=UPI000A29DB01|nr:uncharacterized protein LOC9303741 isoform X1 [Arabidopsis lyrata subsp. lyrata]|eukprot:XP_020873286.1 uncharacterized protein LOC9303741 isoform X1 [Arabidopsis lyrata subsp. lyrata]